MVIIDFAGGEYNAAANTSGMHQMQQALDAFAGLVDQLAGNYVVTDNSGARTFNGLGTGR